MDLSDEADLYLSDVHVDAKYHTFPESNRSVSRFQFRLSSSKKKSKEHINLRSQHEITKEEAIRIDRNIIDDSSLAVKRKLLEKEDGSEVEVLRKRQRQELEVTPVDEDGDFDTDVQVPRKRQRQELDVTPIDEDGDFDTDVQVPRKRQRQELDVTPIDEDGDFDTDVQVPRKRQRQELDVTPIDEDGDLEVTPVDKDGDLEVTRKYKVDEDIYIITIEHSLATELLNVGEQVWRGALILADYLIHTRSHLQDNTVLDLGSGTGLTSVIAALFCKKIYCTDIGENILKIAKHNLDSNCYTISNDLKRNYVVREIDWFQDDFKAGLGTFSPTKEEIEEIKNVDIIIAADVVYDEDITEAFFRTVHKLMSRKPAKTLYVTLEKRFVFTVTDVDIVTPAYTHFRECLKDLLILNDNGLKYSYSQISTDFPQYFKYKRTKEMEIWKINSTFVDQ